MRSCRDPEGSHGGPGRAGRAGRWWAGRRLPPGTQEAAPEWRLQDVCGVKRQKKGENGVAGRGHTGRGWADPGMATAGPRGSPRREAPRRAPVPRWGTWPYLGTPAFSHPGPSH